jgi:manganese transport protein
MLHHQHGAGRGLARGRGPGSAGSAKSRSGDPGSAGIAGGTGGAGGAAAETAVPAAPVLAPDVPAPAFPARAFPTPPWLGRSWAAQIARQGSLTDRTVAAAQDVLAGRRRGISARLAFVGPAVIASIAYMDPGNFATNIQAGAKYGYALLWVVVMANLIAMLFQALSAKLGIVTGRNLAELCRQEFPKPVVWAMWGVSEVAAMATDLAEFLGGAIGLALLLRMPLLAGMAVTAVVTYAILMFEGRGFRPVELIIGGLVGVIGLCYLAEMLIAPVDWGAAAYHTLVPEIADREALLLAVGIIGATVMPHAIFLHSGLTQARTPVGADGVDGADGAEAARRQVLRFSNQEVVIALAIAGMVNMAMVMMASSAFHAGHSDVAEIETAYHTLTPLLGGAAAGVFLVSLIASGISSSAVGTMAGQMIMQGFVGFRIPVAVRRLVTMAPAFVVVGLGVNTTTALVISQVVLSIALPLPMIALLMFTRRRDLMGAFANGRATQAAAIAGTAIVLALNVFLILQTLGVAVPRL